MVGAMESAIEQVKPMAIGMNVGGKIGIARWNEHLCVAIFVGVGVLHFNEVTVGMAHRVLRAYALHASGFAGYGGGTTRQRATHRL